MMFFNIDNIFLCQKERTGCWLRPWAQSWDGSAISRDDSSVDSWDGSGDGSGDDSVSRKPVMISLGWAQFEQ